MSMYGTAFLYREAGYGYSPARHRASPQEVGSLEEFVIRIYNRAGVLVHYLTNRIGSGSVIKLRFDLIETGPGSFSMSVYDVLDRAGYDYRVEVYLYGTTRPWYTGYITTLPNPGQRLGPYEYQASGYYSIFKRTIVAAEEYIDKTPAYIIADLMDKMAIRTGFDINYNPAKISPAIYAIPYMKFKSITLAECFKQLADISKNFLIGVDVDRDVFFKPRSFSVNTQLIFVEGVGYTKHGITTDSSNVVNRVYPKIGKINDGSNILDPIADDASIATYGLREKVVEIPSVFAEAPAAELLMNRWAQGYLKDNGSARNRGTIKGVRQKYNTPFPVAGQVRLLQRDGQVVEGFCKKITYNISNKLDIDIEVGWGRDQLSREFAGIARLAELTASITEMNAEQ